MKSLGKLLILGCICFTVQACGNGDEGESTSESGDEQNATTETNNDSADKANSTQDAQQTKPADDYHITLSKGDESIATGPSTGKAMIADDWICTIGDWKMRILSEGNFNPKEMVGNEYHAQVVSDDFTSMDCQCEIETITGTGEVNSIGERVKAEGKISCDGAETTGTFKIQLIQPKNL